MKRLIDIVFSILILILVTPILVIFSFFIWLYDKSNPIYVGKRIGKNVKFIVNEDSFTGIDIHSKKDLYLAEMAMRYIKKNNLLDH